MVKVYLCVGFSILFSIFYVFSFWFYQNENDKGKIPNVTNEAVNLLNVNDPKAKVVSALPSPGSVKEIHIKSDDYDRKTKSTPLTFKEGQKTISPRLSKEEILKAKRKTPTLGMSGGVFLFALFLFIIFWCSFITIYTIEKLSTIKIFLR